VAPAAPKTQSTGQEAHLIAAHQATLARAPNNVAAQLGLAYLYEARGENDKAQALWARIDPAVRTKPER
jgi:hypothetical protein